jgi:hypothetical protein
LGAYFEKGLGYLKTYIENEMKNYPVSAGTEPADSSKTK